MSTHHPLKVTVLGCGGSAGVPLVGNIWGKCDPENPKNQRLRSSILLEQGDTVLLIDTGPDTRQQLLRVGLTNLTAVLYTHAHADHVHGIDDLRLANWLTKKPLPIYADPFCLNEIRLRFPYILRERVQGAPGNPYLPNVIPHEVTGPNLTIGDIDLRLFTQRHGRITSLGFRAGPFAYSTDVDDIGEDGWSVLAGIDTWIVDCSREAPHPAHAHLDLTIEWAKRLSPRQTYLTHMDQSLDYDTLLRILPPGIAPAYDGLVLEFP